MVDTDSSRFNPISEDHNLSKYVTWEDYLVSFGNIVLDETMNREALGLFKEMKVRLIEYSCNILNIVKQWCEKHGIHNNLCVANKMIEPNNMKVIVPMKISDLESELISKVQNLDTLKFIAKADIEDHTTFPGEDPHNAWLLEVCCLQESAEKLGMPEAPDISHPALINQDVLDETYDSSRGSMYNRRNDYAASSSLLSFDSNTPVMYSDNVDTRSIEGDDQAIIFNTENVATVAANDSLLHYDTGTMDLPIDE